VYHKRGKNERRRGERNHRQSAENKSEIVQEFCQKLAWCTLDTGFKPGKMVLKPVSRGEKKEFARGENHQKKNRGSLGKLQKRFATEARERYNER
jgi:hypothetical protein